MELDLAPSWPPPTRWYLALIIGQVVAAVLSYAGLFFSGLAEFYGPWIALVLALLLGASQLIGRWSFSRKKRILRIPEDELSHVMKLIDSAAQSGDARLLASAREYLTLHLRVSRRDAGTAVGKLTRRDYPQLADRAGYLD